MKLLNKPSMIKMAVSLFNKNSVTSRTETKAIILSIILTDKWSVYFRTTNGINRNDPRVHYGISHIEKTVASWRRHGLDFAVPKTK